MTAGYLLGVDIGTYESKGVIARLDGRIEACAAVPHTLSMPQPGWVEHDADGVWWHDFLALTQALLAQTGLPAGEIAAVGCSGIGPDLLPLDRDGKPLRPAILYGIDTRATAEIAEMEARFGLERILAVSGNGLSSQSVGPKIAWLALHEPDVFDRTRHILTATGYLVFRLTGEAVIDHYTAATFAPLYNLRSQRWDEAMCAGTVDPAVLPRPGWPGTVAGRVTAAAAGETGLAAGTPVIVGTTDAAAEAVSVGVTAPGELMIMYGSTLFFIHVVDHLIIDPRLWAGVYLEPGDSYSLAAGMATAGSLTRWYRDQFGAGELAAEAAGGPNAYAALAAEAARVPPGSAGLLALPYFNGERTPIHDPLARGVIAGLTLTHTRAHMYRALLESVAYGIAHNLEAIRAAGGSTARAAAVGGGTKNALWLQIVSDVTGIPQSVAAETVGAAYGDCFLAGLGAGCFERLGDVKTWVKAAGTYEPCAANQARYAAYYAEFREWYPAVRERLHRLARLGMEQDG
jgi:xylulokinase